MRPYLILLTFALACTTLACSDPPEVDPKDQHEKEDAGVDVSSNDNNEECANNGVAACECEDGRSGYFEPCSTTCDCDCEPWEVCDDEYDLGSPDDGGTDLGADSGSDMSASGERVAIPAGTFMMGCDAPECDADEAPLHEVNLSAFEIDRTEVSQGQYQQCIDAGACTPTAEVLNPVDAQLPMVSVTWQQSQDYCAWAGGSLPTEAQWERACAGAAGATYPWGEATPTCELAQTSGCGDGPLPVDSLPDGASPEGALHLAGNVWEWTADWYAPDAYANHAVTDPAGPASGTSRVYRGGSQGNDASLARCRNRAETYSPEVGGSGLGFRCAY